MSVICDYCHKPAKLVTGLALYPHRPDLADLRFWQCKPCAAMVGTHKGSKDLPLGRLANAELRKAKMAAHRAFDPLWKESSRYSRGQAYAWLAGNLGINNRDCHIGMFDVETCVKVRELCLAKLSPE